MALSPLLFVVRVENKPDRSFGAIMNDVRSWLDHRKIEPVSFKAVAEADAGGGFEIAFNSEDEANIFQREFALGLPDQAIPPSTGHARLLR